MRTRSAGPLLALTALLLAACGGRDRVTVEEHLVLTLAHDPRPVLAAGPEASLRLTVEGNMAPAPGSVRLYWYAEGDTGWTAIPALQGEELWAAPVPSGRRGERAVYFWRASTPSGAALHLPSDLEGRQRPYRTVRAGGYPGLLRFLTVAAFLAGGLLLLGAGLLGLRSLQSSADPAPGEQARLARSTATGAILLAAGALAGMIASMFIWGVPYRGFPLGSYMPHTRVFLLLVVWGGMSWASWGTLSRAPGSRDIFPPRLQATMVLGALLLSVLIVLLPSGGGAPAFPPIPTAW